MPGRSFFGLCSFTGYRNSNEIPELISNLGLQKHKNAISNAIHVENLLGFTCSALYFFL